MHPDCCPSNDPLLPTRVIDVGDDASGQLIKLNEQHGESGRYACLSYCWGDTPNYTLTKNSVELLKTGVDLATLPQTLQDAITTTKALGIRYIWIDW
jgi:hypothetical protein